MGGEGCWGRSEEAWSVGIGSIWLSGMRRWWWWTWGDIEWGGLEFDLPDGRLLSSMAASRLSLSRRWYGVSPDLVSTRFINIKPSEWKARGSEELIITFVYQADYGSCSPSHLQYSTLLYSIIKYKYSLIINRGAQFKTFTFYLFITVIKSSKLFFIYSHAWIKDLCNVLRDVVRGHL